MRLAALITGVLLSLSPPLWAQPEVYTFAVVPQQAATKLAKIWSPLLAEIGKQSGCGLALQDRSRHQ